MSTKIKLPFVESQVNALISNQPECEHRLPEVIHQGWRRKRKISRFTSSAVTEAETINIFPKWTKKRRTHLCTAASLHCGFKSPSVLTGNNLFCNLQFFFVCFFALVCFFLKRIQRNTNQSWIKSPSVTVGKVLVATQNTSEMAVPLLCVDSYALALAKLNRVAL